AVEESRSDVNLVHLHSPFGAHRQEGAESGSGGGWRVCLPVVDIVSLDVALGDQPGLELGDGPESITFQFEDKSGVNRLRAGYQWYLLENLVTDPRRNLIVDGFSPVLIMRRAHRFLKCLRLLGLAWR